MARGGRNEMDENITKCVLAAIALIGTVLTAYISYLKIKNKDNDDDQDKDR